LIRQLSSYKKIETPAILLLKSSKPLVYIGRELDGVYLATFLPSLEEDLGTKGSKLISMFEKR
jgi:hypothetical protein